MSLEVMTQLLQPLVRLLVRLQALSLLLLRMLSLLLLCELALQSPSTTQNHTGR
jgi:hypothetical protein